MVKLLRRLLFELNVIGQQGQRQCALLHRILPDDKIRNTAPKLVQVGGDLIVHDQVHPPCAAGIDQRAACARITRRDRVDTGQLGSLLQQTERMLVNHIAVIVRQRDLLQLKRRVRGKQLLLKALQTFAVRTVIHTGRNDRSHRATLPRHQTHQLGHRTAGRNVFLPDIAQPTAVGQIGVKRNDRYSALVDQLVDFGFDQQTVERRDRQRTDMMLLDQILDYRDLFDRIERGRQPEDDLHAERSQTAGFAPGGIQNDTGKMLQFIESAKNAGDDAVLINLVDAATAQQCIEAAGDMKVVFVNRAPSDTSVLEAGKSVAVVSNENTSGYYQGEFLANYFKDKGKTEIKYLMLQGTLGLVHTEQRSASVLKALEDNGIKATQAAAPLVADYDRANAMDMISPLLGNTEFDCIIANNDAMALGAVEALKAKGMDPTSIPIVGIDATVDGIQAIKDGTLAMTVFQDANGQGYGAVKAAVNLIEGKAINDGTNYETDETGNICWVPFEPVTPDNVADYE